MIIINPPWQLRDKMSRLLPRLVETLGESGAAFFCLKSWWGSKNDKLLWLEPARLALPLDQ